MTSSPGCQAWSPLNVTRLNVTWARSTMPIAPRIAIREPGRRIQRLRVVSQCCFQLCQQPEGCGRRGGRKQQQDRVGANQKPGAGVDTHRWRLAPQPSLVNKSSDRMSSAYESPARQLFGCRQIRLRPSCSPVRSVSAIGRQPRITSLTGARRQPRDKMHEPRLALSCLECQTWNWHSPPVSAS